MRVRLLGTGSADRWPNPWCSCPSCAWARASGSIRQRTSVLVDGCLLIDPGPDIGSCGVDLTGVRTVLITHAHPDHLDPSFLLAWTWGHAHALTVAGPPEAIGACRPWVGPDALVEFRELVAGQELQARRSSPVTGDAADDRLRIRCLPAAHATDGGHAHDGTAMLYEVVGDAALLYATDTAELPHSDLRGQYDLVLLEETFGDRTDHGTAHLDIAGFRREVTRLRAAGRLAPTGRIVAVHLSHHNPPDVDRRLAAIGADVLPDGSELVVPATSEADRRGRR
ncbi:MAG: MBL fold metallo-hydrolase, partial [Candidatus Nanopelagicales bacterium]